MLGSLGVRAEGNLEMTNAVVHGYGESFVFDEGGVTFSVYQNGEFDFYIDQYVTTSTNVNVGNVSITFNSGYNYDPYVQYDDYGAIVQVENIPVYYDYYGRVSAIGSVNIVYNTGRLIQIGGLHVYYKKNVYTHCSGYINVYNRAYVYRPYYSCFVIPTYHVVYTTPYRMYYRPTRYTYYGPYYKNNRQAVVAVGTTHRSTVNSRGRDLYDNRSNRRESAAVATTNRGRGTSVDNSTPRTHNNNGNNRTRGNEGNTNGNGRRTTETPATTNTNNRVRVENSNNSVRSQQNNDHTPRENQNNVRTTTRVKQNNVHNTTVRSNTNSPRVETKTTKNQTRTNTNRTQTNSRSGRRGN